MNGFLRIAIFAVGAALTTSVMAQNLDAVGDAYSTDISEFLPLAEQGDVNAQFNLALRYGNRDDNAEAARWFLLAAEQGHASAQLFLGFMYRNGEGVPQDYVEALRWYRLAAEQGNADAQLSLGYMYANSDGVLRDEVLAYMWFNISHANGGTSVARDLIVRRMTREQIIDAQTRAWRCVSSNYQDCD